MKNRRYEVTQRGELKALEIFLYGDISSDWYDWNGKLHESVTSAAYVQNAIALAGDFDCINVYINSCGGSVMEGVAIHNILKRVEKPVHVYIDAFAYSVASVIAMAGDTVHMPSNASMMIHNAMMGCFGNSAELRKAADDLDVINEASCNSYLSKSDKIDRETLKGLLDAETFLTADKAMKYGFVDEILNPVDLKDSVDIAKQALENKNPVAKMAMEQIRQAQREPEPQKPEPEQKTQDCFEWLAGEIFRAKPSE